MEGLYFWCRIDQKLMREDQLNVEQSVYVKYIDVHLNNVQVKDDTKATKN